MRLWLLILPVLFCIRLFAQVDSSLMLTPERFSVDDILKHEQAGAKRQAISATRSLEDIEQLPFTVWVVTAEDILRNGFVTLGDVLRAAPGVRVSQPGNALEGETFMMRGLPGNRYVKVLINDVPIKPTVAPGMSIGAQLPIRQAERIEVFFGPASAIYGDDACAGVVNIILKETERPIFTQADLGFGSFGYNSLDLMLGGKLFKDQKIFRFSLYGSSTVRERSDIFYDDRLFNPKNYLPLGLDTSVYISSPNYRARDFGDSIARTAPVPHESRLLGINLTFRNIHFNYNRMQRFDHSALGLSPLASSYANPSNRISERIETFALSFQKRRDKRTSYHTLSAIRYKVDNNSSFTPIFDRIGTNLYYSKLPDIQTDAERKAVLSHIYNEYGSNERYYTASGFDARYEFRINATLKPNLYLDLGAQAYLGGGVPPMGYFIGPLETNLNGDSKPENPRPFGPEADGQIGASTFGQLHWKTKKMTLIGGASVNFAFEHPIAPAPRLAIRYQLDSVWTIHGNYAEGVRWPSVNARVNTFIINTTGPDVAPLHGRIYETERIRSAEVAVRRSGKQGYITNLIFFYQEARQLTRNGYYYTNTNNQTLYGYAQAPGLAQAIWGVQGIISNEVLAIDLNRSNVEADEIKARAELYFQYTRGREWFGYNLPATHDLRNFPRWMAQIWLSLYARKWELSMSTNRQNGILSGAEVYRDVYQRQVTETRYPAFRTWDFRLRINLSNHFLVYLNVQNAFNKHYAGIDATGTPDDLLYNAQPGRTLKFGVNYSMN